MLPIITDEQLWENIRGLVGKVIYTPDQHRPNRIRNVSENLAEFEDRNSHPSKDDLFYCYHLVLQHGILIERNTPKYFFDHRIARICYALLAKATPEQIRAFRRREGPPAAQGLSGIEVYNRDC